MKELDCSAEKGREEMKRLREGMAELLDERVGGRVQNKFVSIFKCTCPNCQMYLSQFPNLFVQIAKRICPNGRAFEREGG